MNPRNTRLRRARRPELMMMCERRLARAVEQATYRLGVRHFPTPAGLAGSDLLIQSNSPARLPVYGTDTNGPQLAKSSGDSSMASPIPAGARMDVSIIICTHNRVRDLRDTL